MRFWGGEGVRVRREGRVGEVSGVWLGVRRGLAVGAAVAVAGGAEGGERLWLWLGECLGSACEHLGCRWD